MLSATYQLIGKQMLYSRKSRITYILIIILTIIITSSIPSQVYGEKWIYVCSSSDNNTGFYYDSDSIRINTNDNIIKVWIKETYINNYKDNNRDIWKTFLSDEDWNKLGHSISLIKYNYTDETSSRVSGVSYSYSGEILYSFNSPDEWSPIIPGSAGETLFNKVMEAAGIKK